MTANEPVFVVGHQRSGTTLLAAMLCAHSRLSCGPETQFFNNLSDSLFGKELLDEWPQNAVTFLAGVRHFRDTVSENYGLTLDQIKTFLIEREPSVPSVLAALTEQYMVREKKSRWVEKSPDHLPYVHLIRRWFPRSPIIRIMRDPRDAALSSLKTGWRPNGFRAELILWNDWHDRSAGFFTTDRLSITVRYEDLLSDPKGVLETICEMIGEVYEATMLDTSGAAKHVNRMNEPWKINVGSPIDPSRIGVWKLELSDEQNREAVATLGDRLLLYGYTRGRSTREPWVSADELMVLRAQLADWGRQRDCAQAERDCAQAELAVLRLQIAESSRELAAASAQLRAITESYTWRLFRLLRLPLTIFGRMGK